MPDAQDLRNFVEAASNMDGLRLAELMIGRLVGGACGGCPLYKQLDCCLLVSFRFISAWAQGYAAGENMPGHTCCCELQRPPPDY